AYTTHVVTGQSFSVPVVLFLSLLPDLDGFTFRRVVHRGPTHSLFSMTAVYLFLFLGFGFGLPYYAGLISHSLADCLVPPCKLFWPLSNRWYSAPRWLQLSG